MTADYRTITDDRSNDGKAVRLLQYLETTHRPIVRGMGPKRRLPATVPVPNVAIPTVTWKLPAATESDITNGVRLDANAAYLSAASSVRVGLNTLERDLQRSDGGRQPYPGWYLIDAHPWHHRAIVSPLGAQRRAGRVWVAHPTLQLLRCLEEENAWPDTYVYDCWTSPVSAQLTKWTSLIRDTRAAIKTDPNAAPDVYNALKTGYAMAVELMLKGEKCDTYRPDWAHAIWAQHSAFTVWWKAWRALNAKCGILRMTHPDEVVVTTDGYAILQSMQHLPPKQRPITLDPTGLQLGAYKVIDGDQNDDQDQGDAA